MNVLYKKSLKTFIFEDMSAAEIKKLAFLSAIVFFILGSGFGYVDSYPLHDAISFETSNSYEWQISLGRFLMPLYLMFRGPVPSRALIFVLSALFLGISVCIVVVLLDVRSGIEAILISAFMTVNIFTFEVSAVHQYYSDVFLLAMLFAGLGVYFLRTILRKSMLLSILCFFISFGIYPAFITYAVILLAIMILRELTAGDTKDFLKKTTTRLFSVFMAGICYMAASRLVLRMLHIEPAAVSWSMYSDSPVSTESLFESVVVNYHDFADVFFTGAFLGRPAGLITLILAALSLFVFIRSSKSHLIDCLVVLLMLLFPLCSRLVNIMTRQGGAFRTMYAQFLLLPLIVWLFFIGTKNDEKTSEKNKKVLTIVMVVLSFFLIWKNIQFTNTGFEYRKALYRRTDFHMSRVLGDMMDYTKGNIDKPVAVVGLFDLEPQTFSEFEKYKKVEGMSMDTGITYEGIFNAYAKMAGFDLNCVSSDTVKDHLEFKAIPSYPSDGYISDIDGILVVKLSE